MYENIVNKWAIIKYKGKIEEIRLTDWKSYEWEDFNVYKYDRDNDYEEEIRWFDTKADCIEYILKTFDKSLISEKSIAYVIQDKYDGSSFSKD